MAAYRRGFDGNSIQYTVHVHVLYLNNLPIFELESTHVHVLFISTKLPSGWWTNLKLVFEFATVYCTCTYTQAYPFLFLGF